MKNRSRFTLLAAASCAAALAMAFPSAQATPMPTLSLDNSAITANMSQMGATPIINIAVLGNSATVAANSGSVISISDVAALGSLNANMTLHAVASTTATGIPTSIGTAPDTAGLGNTNVKLISALPGDGRDKGDPTPPTKISTTAGGVDTNTGAYIRGLSDIYVGYRSGADLFAGESELNATKILNSHPGRVAVSLEPAKTYSAIGNGGQVGYASKV